MTTQKSKLDQTIEFLNALNIDIDFSSLVQDAEYIESFDTLTDYLQDNEGLNVDIIYYSDAIDYLKREDPSLTESLEIACELGFEVANLNSEILASLLATERLRTEWYDNMTEIEDFLTELHENN